MIDGSLKCICDRCLNITQHRIFLFSVYRDDGGDDLFKFVIAAHVGGLYASNPETMTAVKTYSYRDNLVK